jgi:DNA-binding CsgD family transcriptional regulator
VTPLDEAAVEPALHAAIEALYAAPFDPLGWQHAIELVWQLLPSVGIALYGYDELSSNGVGVLHAGYDPAAIEVFLAHYGAVNAWAPGFLRSPVGTLLNSDAFLARDALVRTEYYNDWLRPQENLISGWGSLLVNERTRYLAFTATLRARDEDSLGDSVRQVIARLMPHVERAFRIARLVSGAELGPGIESVMESIGHASFALDASGRVLHANALTAALPPEILRLGQDGRLGFTDPATQAAFETGLRLVAGQGHGQATPGMALLGPRGERITAVLHPYATPDNGGWPAFMFGGPVALLIFRREGFDVHTVLRREFGLSPAEAAVALALGEGLSPQDIAAARDTSIVTVRNQMRMVFDKLAVHRQGELAAVLSRIGGAPASH